MQTEATTPNDVGRTVTLTALLAAFYYCIASWRTVENVASVGWALKAIHSQICSYVSHQLRLLYECAPMAFIIEQAGGMASDGTQPVLDIKPKSLHERCPIFIGSAEDVKDYLKFTQSS